MCATQEVLIRNFQMEQDIPSMVQLRVDIEEADQLGDATSEESLRAQFNWPGHEPALDRWVAEAVDTNDAVGYAWTFAQSPRRSIVHVGVDPAWRRRGIGRRLLDAASSRAKVKGAREIVSGARAKSAAGHEFLRANQFTAVGTNRFFTASASAVEPPNWPQGFVIKSLAELGDLAPVVAASNGCYADMWGHRENTETLTVEFLQETMERFPDSYCPNGIFVLFAPNGEVAGLAFSRFEEKNDRGVIDSPGVVPRYRHLGLHRPLVQQCRRWLNGQASAECHLWTYGDYAEAVAIYEELGFIVTPENQLTEYLNITK